ncbi:MAG: type II toxin-antitoxin system VapC family toxin [Sphingopyxis sp.]
MRLLIDTQIALWWLSGDDRLSPAARDLIANGEMEINCSIGSLWEISIKNGQGKLQANATLVARWLNEWSVNILPVAVPHLTVLEQLPPHHRDPFDRLIVAQAMSEGMTIMTSDGKIAAYGVPCIVVD